MVENDVLMHLQSLLGESAQSNVASCRVFAPHQNPWGRQYLLVEWTTPLDDGARRQVVPAESTALDIARLVASHVPGRRIMLNGEPGEPEAGRGRARRRTRASTGTRAARR
ncbi:DUF2866 domain-containing protein [Paraburkholderia adhaesiva]|uniref:DUF2866 domain-containing protein n=1 Tax=Paraburkholderia adhaesiva TaxID=2883244 RepID=UPI0035711080